MCGSPWDQKRSGKMGTEGLAREEKILLLKAEDEKFGGGVVEDSSNG